jgi:hypothetical protein
MGVDAKRLLSNLLAEGCPGCSTIRLVVFGRINAQQPDSFGLTSRCDSGHGVTIMNGLNRPCIATGWDTIRCNSAGADPRCGSQRGRQQDHPDDGLMQPAGHHCQRWVSGTKE